MRNNAMTLSHLRCHIVITASITLCYWYINQPAQHQLHNTNLFSSSQQRTPETHKPHNP
jgi:hypothetical protein